MGPAWNRTKKLNLGEREQPQVTPSGVQPVEEKKSRWGESLVDTKEEVPKGWRGMVWFWSSQSRRTWPRELALERMAIKTAHRTAHLSLGRIWLASPSVAWDPS